MLQGYLSFVLSKISFLHLNILFLLGLVLFGGTIGGRLFQKIKIPQVVGYIIVGILIGQSGLNLVDKGVTEVLQPFSYFALSLIGFMIGGELKKDIFQKYGKQFFVILFFEGMAAFLLVSLSVGIAGMLFFNGDKSFWAVGVLLGAMASATAPAATTDVLWEYKTRGPLTTTVLGIVALDDCLALFLFAVVSSFVGKFLGRMEEGGFYSILHPIYEIGGAVILGLVFGLILGKVINKYNDKDKILAFSLGTVLIVLGLSLAINVDMLMAALTLGVVIVNIAPRRVSKELFGIVGSFAAPIYVLFFVLVGAKLNIGHITLPILLLVAVYLISRSIGKMFGAGFGAKISKSPESVIKYLPFCLFSQAGVAIGLSIVAYQLFPNQIGNTIVMIIAVSTFVVQLIGPPSVKYAVTKAGEVGLNISEEDLMRNTKTKDIMDKNPPLIREHMPLDKIMVLFSKTSNLYYPVVDEDKRLIGVISVDSIKTTFMETGLEDLVLAVDLKDSVIATVSAEATLSEVKEILDRHNLEYVPVVTEENKVEGFIERRMFNRSISTKIMELQKRSEVI